MTSVHEPEPPISDGRQDRTRSWPTAERFPILERTNYLISNSLGAVPAAVGHSLQSYFALWATRGVRLGRRVVDHGRGPGRPGRPLDRCGPGRGRLPAHRDLAHAVMFSAIDYGRGKNKIVTDAMHFPSILYLINEQRRLGAEVAIVPSERRDFGRYTSDCIEAIDETTAIVNLSHVLSGRPLSTRSPPIAARARRVGALTLIDGYQAVGTIPVDVRSLGIDVYIGGCLKWLCGGPGNAFVWVDPDLRGRLQPKLTGWMAHQQPFAFAPELVRRADGWRFLHGTPNIPGLYAARPGLEIINEVGIEAIRAKSLRQTNRLLALADLAGYRCTTPRDPRAASRHCRY